MICDKCNGTGTLVMVKKTSIKGISLIKEFESLHDGDLSKIGLQPKMDPAGIWTEGYGRAMRDRNGKFIKGISNKDLAYELQTIFTEDDAEKALVEDLKVYETIIERKININLNQNQYDALVSHTYNTGGSSTLFKLINERAKNEMIEHWWTTTYITGGGKKLKGLVSRRRKEFNLYKSQS